MRPSAESRSQVTARLEILAAALLFSTGGAAVKACTLSGYQVAGFRSIIAAAFLFAVMPAARRGWTARAGIVGAFYGATMVLYVLANKLTTSANAIFLQDTAPLYVLLLSPWVLRESIRRRDLVVVAFMAVGMFLFFYAGERPQGTAPDPLSGNTLAIISGVTWAGTIMGLRLLRRNTGATNAAAPAIVIGNVLAFAFCAAFTFPVAGATPKDAALVGYLGIFQIGLAYIFLTRAVAHVPALEIAVLLLIEPVINPVWTWLFHGEVPRGWSIAGGAVILATTTLKSWLDARSAPHRRRTAEMNSP